MFKKKGGASKNTIAGVSIFFDGTNGGQMVNPFIESLLIEKTKYDPKKVSNADLQRGATWPVQNVDVPSLLKTMA